jgi:hypothetical protein
MKMKIGKLLAAGKSWAGGNGIGRYQMRDGLHLPKFISPKNPFKQEAVAQPSAPPAVAAAPAMTTTATEPAAMSEPAPVAVVAPQAATKVMWRDRAVAMAKLTGELAKRAGLFFLDHNPFSAIGRPKLSGIPRFGKPAVQGELSLDRVKVVRNDLSHADLEVIRLGVGPK